LIPNVAEKNILILVEKKKLFDSEFLSLLELLCVKKEKLQCAFIDFEKAFAFDQRNSLLFKLINNNIHGNFYRIVENMYSDAKSRIVHNNKKSDMFACVIGVRDRPFNLKGGGGVWFFVSFRIFYSDNTRVRIFNFKCYYLLV
jgi:hypothetical protein